MRSTYLAHNTDETLAEARRLSKAVNRPNLLIKVPATPEDIQGIQQLISEGINVNVTLLFSQAGLDELQVAVAEALG